MRLPPILANADSMQRLRQQNQAVEFGGGNCNSPRGCDGAQANAAAPNVAAMANLQNANLMQGALTQGRGARFDATI